MGAIDRLEAGRSALVLVDYQERLMPAIHDAEAVLARAVRLADAARLLGVPVLGTEQNAQGLGPTVEALRGRCERVLAKTHFDACGDGLAGLLEACGGPPRDQVVIAGCEAHVCLMQTTLGLLRAGRPAWVVEPACGSRRPSDHALAMQRLRQAGATMVSPEMVLFEWLADCRHPQFKALLQLVKSAD